MKNLFRLGPGPSSSHTIAPYNAARRFVKFSEDVKPDSFVCVFYGSLALTGVGHASGKAVVSGFAPYPCEVKMDPDTVVHHPLTMDFFAMKNGVMLKKARYYSRGGGAISSKDDPGINEVEIYPTKDFSAVKSIMKEKGYTDLKQFCLDYESPDIDAYLFDIVKRMFECVESGLQKEGKIPANNNPRLQLFRSAKFVFEASKKIAHKDGKKEIRLTAYAYAVVESNACGETIVTAPTCGASGVLPSCLYYLHKTKKVPLTTIRDALYTAGIFGNIVKQNASIAGSIAGCQAEIGTASSMAAAAVAYCSGLSLYQIEYAAECAMEHFLGLSCDPVDGYVIIPCIERNGMGAIRAYASYLYAKNIAPIRKNQVSFDDVVVAMKLTGDSLSQDIKETATGGLAKILRCN